MRTLIFIVSISISQILYSQYTIIPDQNFEQKLISLGYDNQLNGQVLTSVISQISILNLNNSNISNLSGIEDFSSLTSLYCSDNPLLNTDLSQNSALSFLSVGGMYFTGLSSFNLSQNQNLFELKVNNIQLTNFNLDLSNTYIEKVSLSNVNTQLLTIGNSSFFTTLTGYVYSNNYLNIGTLLIQNSVNFQGLNFREFYPNNNNNLFNVNFDNNSVSNLKTFEVTNLKFSSSNMLWSSFTNLNYLFIDGSLISNADLSYNSNLIGLSVENSSTLTGVKICSSKIDSINVSNCPFLSCLTIKSVMPPLSSYFSIHSVGVPNLYCIEVQDENYFSILYPSNYPTNFINLDPQISYGNNCNNSCSFTCDIMSLLENDLSVDRKLVKVTDSSGRESHIKSNQLMFYYYSDGSIEKKVILE